MAFAEAQVAENAQRVRNFVKHLTGPVPTYAAVVLWSAEPSDLPFVSPRRDGVDVISGSDLRRWLDSISGHLLDHATIVTTWSHIERQTGRRDQYELEKHGPAPKTPAELVMEAALLVAGLLGGAYACAVVAQVAHVSDPLILALMGLLTAAAWPALAARRLRRVAIGWIVGGGGMTVGGLVVVILAAFGVLS